MWLEDFGLGRVSSEMRYKEGILTFRRMKGLYQTSRYSGNLSINLLKNRLYLTGKIPYADLDDLRQLFDRRYHLPVPVSGTGSGEIKVWGPLAFDQLSYNLRTSFYRGNIANEAYDEIVFQVAATDGNVKAEQVHLSKSNSRITLKGGIKSTGEMDLVLLGRDLRLEQSENLEKLNLNMTGVLDFTTSLRGPIRRPKTDMHGRLSRLVVADRPYEDSNFKMKFTSQTIQGGGNFMGNLIKSNFILPLNDEAPFRLFVETNSLNFTQLFNVFAGLSSKKDFEARLTSTIDLRSEKGGFFNSTGKIKIADLLVRRGSVSMSAPKPILLDFKDGVVNSKDFNLVGHSTYITFLAKNSSKDNLNVNINGKLDMSLGLLFTPFLADLNGLLSMSGQMKGSVDSPELLGSAFIDKGLVRIKGFPHPVEQIRADLLFSHKNVVINAANGQLGGGPFTADGRIRINKFSEIPVNIKGHFKDISLEVPKGVRTKGSGNFTLTGNWFPYTLGGTLNILDGEVTKEIGGESSRSGKIRPSSFLPDFLLRNTFQPVILDLLVNFQRPIMVKNSLVETEVNGTLKVKGDIEAPRLKGQLNLLKDGKVFFGEKDNPFFISVGRLEFTEEDSENPTIFLTANSRINEEYDINLLVQGKGNDPKINLTSQPPLTEHEIISLLTLNIDPNAEPSSLESSDLAKKTSLEISGAILATPLSNINKLTGVEVDVSGATGADGTVVPNLTLKKQWSPKFGVSASRTVETNPTNNAKMEYKVNRNFSVIGTWENKEGNPEVKDTAADKVGVDLEYKVEFK